MSTLVFDIETVGEAWTDLDQVTKDTLLRWVKKTSRTNEEYEYQKKQIEESLGFSPFTGMIVALGLYDLERERGVVYYQSNIRDDEEYGDFVLKPRSESEILEGFWDGVQNYETFVTFNGRAFDVPFLIVRSLAHDVTPTRDLMGKRFIRKGDAITHIDLQDQLTFYGAVRRKPSLHLACRALGIKSPKEGEVHGDRVAELFRMKKFRDIATYNAEDVVATATLYRRWKKHLMPDDSY